MRHELRLGEWIVTSDNSAAIGGKPLDEVKASDRFVAKFAARVALLEQWAAKSKPEAVLLHNFSGAGHWEEYAKGIEELFHEAGMLPLPITGSSETNMETLQSGLAVTIMGRRLEKKESEELNWFAYGMPLVGDQVLADDAHIADLKKINTAFQKGLIERCWPVGSSGIAAEVCLMMKKEVEVTADVDLAVSGGPATCVLLGTSFDRADQLAEHFGNAIFPLKIEE